MSYISNKLSKSKIKKVIPPKTALKTIRYPRNHLTKEVKDLYFENCKTFMKEI